MYIKAFSISSVYQPGDIVEYNSTLFVFVPGNRSTMSFSVPPDESADWFSIPDIIQYIQNNYSRLNILN